jgi:hypothetical protein
METRPGRDVCSRCGRVEEILRLDLDQVITGKEEDLDQVLALMDEQVERFQFRGNKATTEQEGLASLKTAVRRYHDFRCFERERR